MNRLKRLLSRKCLATTAPLLMMVLTPSDNALAATITWGEVTSILSARDIDNSGIVVEAENYVGFPQTVNDINFEGGNSTATHWTAPDGIALPEHDTGDTGLNSILDTHVTSWLTPSHAAGHFTLELENLAIGKEYQLQIIGIHDARDCCGDRTYVVGDGTGNFFVDNDRSITGPQLTRSIGGTLIGTFTADASTQDLLITRTVGPGGADPGLSGYILSEAVPEPTSVLLLGQGGLILFCRRRRK